MKIHRIYLFILLGIIMIVMGCWKWGHWKKGALLPIKVGILHSLSGTMALSERGVADATLLAIAEINAAGGLLGREIAPMLVDGRSDAKTFAVAARRLIEEDKVNVIFGCWTSDSRKTVRPIIEEHDHLLFYPVQYEGLEQSPNIVYTGAAPNQQIIPAVKWARDNLGKRFFLVGSDYIFPRTANAIIRVQLNAIGGEIMGEEYLLLGSREVQEIIDKIVKTRPDVILNTINGDSNGSFFAALRQAGISPQQTPTISFSIAENEIASMDPQQLTGDYAAWNYFQSIDSSENAYFVAQFKKRFGANRAVSDPMEAAWFGVHIWAQAVNEAGTTDPKTVRQAIRKQQFMAPEGWVSIDRDNNLTWKTVRIGKIRGDGQFDIVWSSGSPIPPVPYPGFLLPSEWHRLLDDLYRGWDQHWANPGRSMP